MGVVMIFVYGKRFRFAPSFNNYSKMYLILWNIGKYSSSFSEYDLKHKKRQKNNPLITWFLGQFKFKQIMWSITALMNIDQLNGGYTGQK